MLSTMPATASATLDVEMRSSVAQAVPDWRPEMKQDSAFTALSQLFLPVQVFWKKTRAFVLPTG